ncbi:MAG: archease [archaeon]
MEKFTYFDHTADAKFQAFGKTLEEAFTNSALAMYGIMLNCDSVIPQVRKKINVSATRIEPLLYDFLGEFLFLIDTEGFMLAKIEHISISKLEKGYNLICTALGDSYKNYDIKGDIKAITYNDMKIEEKDGIFIVQAVVDI